MSPPVEVQYRDLLQPIKDPEKCFGINISDLLQSYITNFIQGKIPPNFNSAALLLQGSSSIYGKKVEYLHNLATVLYSSLVKNNRKEAQVKKDPKEREKHTKENKLNDPFFSIDIKPGKNLSCLRKKNLSKTAANKKAQKKSNNKKYSFVPVDLLPLEGEEKGDVFYDVRGDAIGNTGDHILNKCRVTTSGWLLLPTVCPELIPSDLSPSDYSMDYLENGVCHDDSDSEMPESTPDEGYPASSGCPSSQDTIASSQVPSSQQTDEGVGSLPCTPSESECPLLQDSESPMEVEVPNDDIASEGIENIPMDGLLDDINTAVRPVRRSMRQALKLCQLEQEGDLVQPDESNTNEQTREEVLIVKRAIQKKNTCNIPSKLRMNGDENITIHPASQFCARTFFSLDYKFLKNGCLTLGVSAFENNSKIFQRLKVIAEVLRASKLKKKRKKVGDADGDKEDEEDEDVDVVMDGDPDDPDDFATPALEDADIVIENNPMDIIPPSEELPLAAVEPVELSDTPHDSDPPNSSGHKDTAEQVGAQLPSVQSASVQLAQFRASLNQYVQTSDISERVHKWERKVKPILDMLEQREPFDINQYGARILNAFEDNNRKQTIRFRDFCEGMAKWQVHRYFMALLPLVNIGNVSIESDKRNDKEEREDILITLLSRKMHHKELEEFGHGEGSHS